jgi:hypothetical protein
MAKEPAHWGRPEVQQSVQESILADLEDSLMRWMDILRPDLYSTYEEFMSAFCGNGGAVEAEPSNIQGRPSSGLMITPTGEVSVLCTHDNLFYNSHVFAAGIFPQTCVPAAAVFGASKAVGQTLFNKGVFGYVELQFTAWYDQERKMPCLWANKINLELTRKISSFKLFDFLMNGRFDSVNGEYEVNLPRPRTRANKNNNLSKTLQSDDNGNASNTPSRLEIMNRGQSLAKEKNTYEEAWHLRSYVFADSIRLRRIARLHYGTFFNLCRLEKISFDLPRRSGTVFQLIDSLSRGIFGLMTISRSTKKALSAMWKDLLFIKDQVAANEDPRQRGRRVHEADNFAQILSTIRYVQEK